jgi:hypothetical protein
MIRRAAANCTIASFVKLCAESSAVFGRSVARVWYRPTPASRSDHGASRTAHVPNSANWQTTTRKNRAAEP